MTARLWRVLSLAFIASGLSVYFGCTQPDDILTPISHTDIHLWGNEVLPGKAKLKPQCLPTNPEGMIYELWVANDQETLSVGKFGYRQFPYLSFHDASGNLRADSNLFVLDGDIYDYSHIFVSVETNPDPDPTSPGAIMLIDEVTEPSSNLIELRFPLSDSLWNAIVRFNMETTSDDDRQAFDAYGVWFATYYQKRAWIQDTLHLDSFVLRYEEDSTLPADTFTTYIVDIINDTAVNLTKVLGLETVTYTVIRYDSVLEVDSTPPYTIMDVVGDSNSATWYWYEKGDSTQIVYDDFSQDNFALPDYSDYHWKYKGWIVSPAVPKDAFGEITLPGYVINNISSDSLIPGIDGGLLTTGTFSKIEAADDSNPYSLGPRVPPFPGEDFLANLPGGLDTSSWGGLLPSPSGNSGTVFITLEPDNYVNDTTNFPLFVMVRPLPTSRGFLADTLQQLTMDNLTPTDRITDAFPLIVVDIKRF